LDATWAFKGNTRRCPIDSIQSAVSLQSPWHPINTLTLALAHPHLLLYLAAILSARISHPKAFFPAMSAPINVETLFDVAERSLGDFVARGQTLLEEANEAKGIFQSSMRRPRASTNAQVSGGALPSLSNVF
jgi:hypothetical protein